MDRSSPRLEAQPLVRMALSREELRTVTTGAAPHQAVRPLKMRPGTRPSNSNKIVHFWLLAKQTAITAGQNYRLR